MKSKKKIGLVIPQFPGQTHIFFWREILELRALGVDVSLFSTRKPPAGLISHDWSEEAIALTSYLADIPMRDYVFGLFSLPWLKLITSLPRNGISLLREAIVCAGPARRLRRIAKAEGISHVHVHSCAKAAMIAAVSRLEGGPDYSLTLHGLLSGYGPAQDFKWRHASAATVVSQTLLAAMKSDLPDALPQTLVVQPMGVDVADLTRTKPYRPPSMDGPIRIFSCGRLNLIKGHRDLMDAVENLNKAGFDVSLEIAGEDDAGGEGFRKVIEAHKASLTFSHKITLHGAISATAVKSHLETADMFVLASWEEALGVAYMEAMSLAVPTIGTRVGGVPELIEDGETGLLVPAQDPQALGEAIKRLIHDPDLCIRLSNQGRAEIEAKYHSRRGAETLVKLAFDPD